MTVLTVTLNAAIDKRYDVAAITIGEVQRVTRVYASAGGKGLNVARSAQLCGQRVIATGFVAGFAGQFVTSQVSDLGMHDEFLQVAGETRTCINIIEPGGRSTEFLEPGVTVGASDIDALYSRFDRLLAQADVVTLSGSAPSGCPLDVYAPLVITARRVGKQVLLDTAGDLLTAALAARPTVVKPNRDELAALTGHPLDDMGDLVSAARALLAQGPEWVVVSLGADGVIAVGPDLAVRAHGLPVTPVNTVGCGDVLVGALASGMASGRSVLEALPDALCASAASAAHPETGQFDPALRDSLRHLVITTQLQDN